MAQVPQLLPVPRTLERHGEPVRGAADRAAQALVDPDPGLPPQGYELRIDAAGTRIRARDRAGLRHGEATLAQIREQCRPDLPALRILDWPDFPVRGYLLDVSRDRVPTRAALLELVELLAALRINQLQLYTEHTFAYRDHEPVWRDASPLTPEEIRELDLRCTERGIELVPNQNSFGHMERWLRHPAYRHLAEIPDARPAPRCLAPTPESVEFMRALYRELLPCFRSRTINIGCDETFELGRGRSRGPCETRGRGRVYLDYLLRLVEGLRSEGCSVQFWGDVLRRHPELVRELPREGVTALVWGYEAPRDPDRLPASVREGLERAGFPIESLRGFEGLLRPFAEAGIPFHVCPGTSTWNSLIGRLPNARANLLDGARAGRAAGAAGYLITDWGDHGHLQPPVVSLPPLVYGAAVSWCADRNQDLCLETALGRLPVHDPEGTLARALTRLGAVYTDLGLGMINASPIAQALLTPLDHRLRAWGRTDARRLAAVIEALEQARGELGGSADPLRRELRQAASLARHGAWRLGHLLLARGPSPRALRADLAALIREQAEVWQLRARAGGLRDSLARLERSLQDYREREGGAP